MLFGCHLGTPPTKTETILVPPNNNRVAAMHHRHRATRTENEIQPLMDHATKMASLPLFCRSRDGYEYRAPGIGMQLVVSHGGSSIASSDGCHFTSVVKPMIVAERKVPPAIADAPKSATTLSATEAIEAQLMALRIDKMSARIFPSLFALFNVFY